MQLQRAPRHHLYRKETRDVRSDTGSRTYPGAKQRLRDVAKRRGTAVSPGADPTTNSWQPRPLRAAVRASRESQDFVK